MSLPMIINKAFSALVKGDVTAQQIPEPFTREIFLVESRVAGTYYRELVGVEDSLRPGDKLILKREPDNSHDDLAIMVFSVCGVHLGYVPRAKNETLARLMDAGKLLTAKLTGKKRYESRLELDMEIYIEDV